MKKNIIPSRKHTKRLYRKLRIWVKKVEKRRIKNLAQSLN